MLKIEKFIFSPFYENTFVVWDYESREAMIIDPGCYSEEEENKLSGFIADAKLKVKYLLNTHCHIDHIFGNQFVKEKYNCEFLIPEKDLFLLNMMMEQGRGFGINAKSSPQPDSYLTEELKLQIGGSTSEFLFTPGHTPGEYCILFRNENICFTGDVLFRESIGRTDLWEGNQDDLYNSIRNKLFVLNDEVKIYPGHGEQSTIGYEKQNNPFF